MMSFSCESKRELVNMQIKNGCCRRNLFYGMMFDAKVSGHTVSVGFDVEASAKFISEYAGETLAFPCDIEQRYVCGRERFFVTFISKNVAGFINKLDFGGRPLAELLSFKCGLCMQSFLRGVFLAVGSVNDPQKSFHTELSITGEARAEKLDAYLAETGLPARRISRGKKIGLYYKSGGDIEEFFSEIGANNILFSVINSKIEKEIRNNENRATNCVATNIAKTVSATAKQIDAIESLKASGRFELLPDDLKITAELRLANPDASLSELSDMHTPKISKSGLNHRLGKIFAELEKTRWEG